MNSGGLPKCFKCYGSFLCGLPKVRCGFVRACRDEVMNEKQEEGCVTLHSEVAKVAFNELKELKMDIEVRLMPMVQNSGMPITQDEMLRFENDKNDIINRLNKIGLDIKIEYDRRSR